ncbi:MAG: transposase, partial [Alcaligenaceae bacterium]|nr:transposase [Alcaligenaceae bacterium]
QSMLACLLRPSRIDGARHAAAVLRLLVTRLRQTWPDVKIIIRGDSGFCRQRLLRWCERANVQYIIGLARNTRLQARVKLAEQVLERDYRRTGSKQRLVSEFIYAAASWN